MRFAELGGHHWHKFTAFDNLPKDLEAFPRVTYRLAGTLVDLDYHETRESTRVKLVLVNSMGTNLTIDLHPEAIGNGWFKAKLQDIHIDGLTLIAFDHESTKAKAEVIHGIHYRVPTEIISYPKGHVTRRQRDTFELIDRWAPIVGPVQQKVWWEKLVGPANWYRISGVTCVESRLIAMEEEGSEAESDCSGESIDARDDDTDSDDGSYDDYEEHVSKALEAKARIQDDDEEDKEVDQ
ncbi:uncharacterized protein PSFLO_00644 [Pseudozyma flocculosa]|uniref:Uncharacterized protein n=2 Tax=Pseudozyma flocculosa TaxID=84751 RepID=A0A5C3ES81_9BASI|nr:uncharacterized protein PSFLO_00644 [Pseudozyma flocculosa]